MMYVCISCLGAVDFFDSCVGWVRKQLRRTSKVERKEMLRALLLATWALTVVSQEEQKYHLVLNYAKEVPKSSLCAAESLVRALRSSPSGPATVVLWARKKEAFLAEFRETLSAIAGEATNGTVTIRVERLSVPEMLKDTPMGLMSDWGKKYVEQNKANAVRLAIVYKFGGAYLDTDVIVVKNPRAHSFAPKNVVIEERPMRLNNAAFQFERGHPFLGAVMDRFVSNFKAIWGNNGPRVFTDVYSASCNFTNSNICKDITMIDQYHTGPIGYRDASQVFIETHCDDCDWRNRTSLQPTTTLVHLYNKRIDYARRLFCYNYTYSTTVLAAMQREACPLVYAAITRTVEADSKTCDHL